MSAQEVIVYFDSWAGRRAVSAYLIGVTKTRYRVRWKEDAPGGRRKGAVWSGSAVGRQACIRRDAAKWHKKEDLVSKKQGSELSFELFERAKAWDDALTSRVVSFVLDRSQVVAVP